MPPLTLVEEVITGTESKGMITCRNRFLGKCKECKKVQHVSDLKENESGEGKVCIDADACRARKLSNNKSSKSSI